MRKKPTTEIEYLHEIVSSAVWDVLYHERELRAAHQHLAIATAALQYVKHSVDLTKVTVDDYDDNNDPPETTDDYLKGLLAARFHDIEWHENKLADAHQEVGFAKALLARANYPELKFEAIAAVAQKQIEESK
jgi:hypothetical protein